MTSVAQLMRAAIFGAGIKGDSTAADRKSPGDSGGTRGREALHCFELINRDGNTSVTALTTLWVPLCVHMRITLAKEN